MGGSSKSVTVGYKYYVGMHMVFCHGPVDKFSKFAVDDKTVWIGSASGGTSVYIDAAEIFGGESREGGISGTVDILDGDASQGQNAYLVAKLGAYVPSFRGVASAVLRQVYMGLNPYLKKWKARIQRIHIRQDGLPQWYDEKAEVSEVLYGLTDYWRYKTEAPGSTADYSSPSYDDSSWPQGRGGFGNLAQGYNTPPAGTIIFGGVSPVPEGCSVWIRHDLGAVKSRYIAIEAWHDDGAELWFNGTPIAIQELSYFRSITQIPPGLVNPDGPNLVVMKVTDSFKNGSPAGNPTYIYAGLQMLGHADMNPAHIIRECLTDPDWGMGYQDADIDDASFVYAADRLYDERMGMSILWDTQTSIEEFIKAIVRHIDAAVYVDRQTGKFVLKLIRDDYDEETLIQLGPNNIDKVTDLSRPAFGELTNSVTVSYWDAALEETSTITVQDIALAQEQGATINTSLTYEGFTNASLASRVAQRDLKTLSTPLVTCTIYANRDASVLNIGSVFKFSWPDYDIHDMIMRVTGIAYGDGKTNKIRINCAQDVFALPETALLTPPGADWQDPNSAPNPIADQIAYEVPYLEMVQREGQANVDTLLASSPEVAYVGAACLRPNGSALNARMNVNSGAGYEDVAMIDFAPGATLTDGITKTQTTFGIADAKEIENVTLGVWGQIGNEIVKIEAISDSSVTVGRGVLDTVPQTHSAGDKLFIWDIYSEVAPTEYVASDVVNIKLLTVSGAGQVALSSAAEMTVNCAGRAARPYPPGDFRINGVSYPDAPQTGSLTATWAHRDRKQQTGGDYIDHTYGNIGPEAGTTYRVRYYLNGVLEHTESGITGTSATPYTFSNNGVARIEVDSLRDSLHSYQAVSHEFNYTLAGSVGEVRITEDLNRRITEDGNIRITG